MRLTEPTIKLFLGALTYSRAVDYYKSGRVGPLKVTSSSSGISLSAHVKGSYIYSSSVDIRGNSLLLKCTCPAFYTFNRCKHTGAILIKFVRESYDEGYPSGAQESSPEISSSCPAPRTARQTPAADRLLSAYSASNSKQATIEPSLYMDGYKNLFLTFTFGVDRQYVVKDVFLFVHAFQMRKTLTYGTKFTYTHDPNALSEKSGRLFRLISAHIADSERFRFSESNGNARYLPLFGWALDEFFDLYCGESIPLANSNTKWHLIDGNPTISLSAEEADGFVHIEMDGSPQLISGAHHDYVLLGNDLYRITENYAQTVNPLIDRSSGSELVFSPKGAEEFCQNVLPKIRELVPINGENAFARYLPTEMDVRYYIDLPERDRMTAQPFFAYGSTLVEADDPLSLHPEIHRNGTGERAAIQALIAFFDPPADGGKLYELTNNDRMFDFLSEGISQLEAHGEVFISDRLKNMHLKKPSRMSIGVSVGESVLNLKLDMGEFPIGELEALRAAMREKRRYYRMADGHFLDTDSSELNAFAEVADALDLTNRDLVDGAAEIPMSRALYLDNAFKQDGDITFSRDAAFRRLVRDFRTVDDSDYLVPEPLDGVLRNYQKTGYRWLRTLDAYRFGGILADDMGLGKTLQVLTYLLSIRRERDCQAQSGPRASLIVCPASLLLNWAEEARKWTPELEVCLLCGNAANRELEIQRRENYDILITSYDLIKRDIDAHRQANYYACILDEAQFIKNHETKGSKAVKDVRAMVHIALTGTPVENRLSELWSIFDFLMPGYLYKYAAFRSRMETPIAKNADKKAQENLRRLVSPFILRRMKKDVLNELPPKIETVHYVQMDEEQRKVYLAYAWDVKKSLESATDKDKMRIIAMLTRLRQLCCDPALYLENYHGGSCKLDECARMLDELTQSGHSVLVFSQFTSMLDRIRDRLDEIGIDSFTLQGDTPRETRAELVSAFNRGEAPVFLISLKAGGTGLNLTAADTVIHYDPWWNIAAQNQATDRCYRIGQTRKVQVYQLIARDTIEENILKLQSSKQKLVESIVDAAEGSLMSMSKEELMSLVDAQ